MNDHDQIHPSEHIALAILAGSVVMSGIGFVFGLFLRGMLS